MHYNMKKHKRTEGRKKESAINPGICLAVSIHVCLSIKIHHPPSIIMSSNPFDLRQGSFEPEIKANHGNGVEFPGPFCGTSIPLRDV